MITNCFWWEIGVFCSEDNHAYIDLRDESPFSKLLFGLYFHSVISNWKMRVERGSI